MFRKVASYSASIYGVTLFASAVSFAVTMVIARRIPKEALGAYGFYVTVYSFLGMLLCSGLNQALVKFLGDKQEDHAELTRILVATCAMLALLCWPLAFAAGALGWTSTAWGLAALPFSILCLFAASRFRTEFKKKGEVSLRLAVSLLNSTLTFAFAFLAGKPAMAPIWGDFLSMAIPGLVLVAIFLRFGGPRSVARAVTGDTARRLLRFGVPLVIAGAAFVVYTNASSLLIRGIVGLAALGEFYFAVQLMNVLEKPMTILSNVLLAAFANDPRITPEKHRRFVTFNMAVFPLIAAGVAWGAPLALSIADRLLARVGGEPLATKYALAPAFVSLFALAVPARCVEFLLSTLAIARGLPHVNRNTHVTATSVSLPVLAALVWWKGAWGAAAMPLVYITVFLVVESRMLRAEMPEIVRHCARAAVTGTLLLAGVLLLARATGSPPWLFPFACAGYLAIGHLVGGWDLRSLIPKRQPRAAERAADVAGSSSTA